MKKLTKLRGLPHDKQKDVCLRELTKIKPHKFIHDGFDVEIVEVGHENGLLRVVAKARRNGVELPVNNPLLYKNPPIMVPDGTFETVIDADTGSPRQRANFHENPQEALRQIVTETIKVTT